MKRLEVSQERVLDLFKYEDGKLFRKSDGKMMGCYSKRSHRYVRIGIDGKNYKLHRIIFLYHNGYIPKIIDHINGNRYDNRIENLREADTYQNRQNSGLYSSNKSGIKNVYWNKKASKWVVAFSINGKRKYFGIYKNIEDAEKVATSMRNKYLKEFANHGFY